MEAGLLPVSLRPKRVHIVKETPRRRITLTSSLNEISTNQLGNREIVREGGRRYSARPHPFLKSGF